MPYSPQTQYTAPNIIAQSLIAGNQNAMQMGEWLSNFLDRQKQISAAGKSADYFLKANPQAAAEMGIHPDEWNNLGARDKAAAVQGYMQSKAAQGQAAELAARTQWMQEQAVALGQRRELEGQEAEAWPRFMQLMANGGPEPTPTGAPPMPGTTPGMTPPATAPDMAGSPMLSAPGVPAMPPTMLTSGTGTGPAGATPPMPQRMLAALAQMGATNPRLASALARQVMPALLNQNNPKEFFERGDLGQELPGADGWRRVPTGPNTSQLIYAGSDVGVPQPAHDADGNLIGTIVKDSHGRQTVNWFKGNAKFQPAVDANTGAPIPNFYVTPEGKTVDARSLIEKNFGGDQSPVGTATGAPVYKTKQDVTAAFKAGKLSRQQAADILKKQFNVAGD